ncbi:MAG: radical SAM family heme chaperone HemW [Acidobacteriota bacterium]|jgi:oxygen-independent coproporphyrinogen-3 oxidase|nr:radical SAM family heme chaperone HemW [Acidobacteriota bacterium]
MSKAGIYIHIPFCKSRCSYCDFATDVYRNNDAVERYVNALISEITNYELRITNYVETIYFGGGTPSLLTAKQLEKILKVIYRKFEFDENIEFTLEMNPATVSLEKLLDFKSLGVNRASFGVQTFDDRALKILARGHDADDARKTFELLRQANFENISFDLIGGLPNQSLKDWEKNLDEALNMNPEHLSLYLLEVHEETPLAEQIRSERQPLPDEDLAGEMYEMMIEKVRAKGFEQYEISNFARTGFESKHNNKYWLCEPVFGFGVSAHSFDGINKRWSNERDTKNYVSLVENGESAVVEIDDLSEKQLSAEFAFLNLRLAKGLNLYEFEKKFGINLMDEYTDELRRFEEMGLIKSSEDFLRLTRKGFVYSNEVFALFV